MYICLLSSCEIVMQLTTSGLGQTGLMHLVGICHVLHQIFFQRDLIRGSTNENKARSVFDAQRHPTEKPATQAEANDESNLLYCTTLNPKPLRHPRKQVQRSKNWWRWSCQRNSNAFSGIPSKPRQRSPFLMVWFLRESMYFVPELHGILGQVILRIVARDKVQDLRFEASPRSFEPFVLWSLSFVL